MARMTAELVAKLVDQVSGPARKVADALKAAERQTKAIAAATKAGLGNRFTGDLVKIGASAGTIDRVTRSWEAYRRSAGLAADSTKWTKAQIAQVKQWERSHLQALKSVAAAKAGMAASSPAVARAAGPQGGGAVSGVMPLARGYIGPVATGYAAVSSVKKHAEAERAITRIGVTADATAESLKSVGETSFRIAQDVAMPYAKVVGGLDTLVAQGATLEQSMKFLPSVARTASATGSEVEDIAKTAFSVGTNFKIAGSEMQKAFDVMATGGKAGQFELKDMARYIPSLAPAAQAVGFTGEKGLTDLVSMLQVIRKGSGTSEEAATAMQNILQKMTSEETTKRFKKFGIDVRAAMEKGRAEGKNLIEVFEGLTLQATKGDLSKLPELINDMQFAQGMRALLTYKGEWQKLSGVISKTAAGTVDGDLAKVMANTQAKLDRLANSYEKRMRQLGSVISDILVPIDNKIEEITNGKNPTANAIDDRAKLVNADHVARAEQDGAAPHPYTPDFRRHVDARRQMIDRQRVDDKIAALDKQIAEKEAILARGKAVRVARIATEQALGGLRSERDGIVGARRASDSAQVGMAENEAQWKRTRTSIVDAYNSKPQPITPGLSSFGFGMNGTRNLAATSHPLPPTRPESLPRGVAPAPMLNTLDDVLGSAASKPSVDSSEIDAATTKAGEAKDKLSELNTTVTPSINLAPIQELVRLSQQALDNLTRLGGAAGTAKTAMSGIGTPAASGRGRSDVAAATASLSRSRETNMTDRSYT